MSNKLIQLRFRLHFTKKDKWKVAKKQLGASMTVIYIQPYALLII